MKASKLASVGLGAGLLLAIFGVISNSNTSQPAAAPAARISTSSIGELHGLAPLDEVVALFRQRSDDHPLDYYSRTQLGAALNARAREDADLELYEEAESVLRDALAINPTHRPAVLTLAGSLHSQHRFEEALALATAVQSTDPSLLTAVALVGDANFELGDYAAAARAYDELVVAERSAASVSRLARLAWVRGENERAVALAEEALSLSQDFPLRPSDAAFYRFQLGHFLFEAGDVPGSIVALEAALAIDPSHPGARERLAWVSAATGDLDRSAELYRGLIHDGAAPDLHGSYADVLRELGHVDEADAQERLGRDLAAETMDRFPAERRHLAEFFMTREPALAVELAAADLEYRQDVGAYDTMAWASFHARDFEAAEEFIQAALVPGTRSARILYHAAAISAALDDTETATLRLNEALAINPGFHPTEAIDAIALRAELTG